jgi:hypothetical protein
MWRLGFMIKGNMENIKIENLLDSYLRIRTDNTEVQGQHLDDDALSALVEGRLGEVESKSITTHLVDCGFCRNVTTELVRLEFAFADDSIVSATTQPTEVSGGFFARLFGNSIGEVFAHQESEEEKKVDSEDTEK